MGFPQSIRELEPLNKLLNEVAAELNEQEQELPASDEPADEGGAAVTMKPQVKFALDHLACELHAQVFAKPLTTHSGQRRALLEAMWARETHFIAVAVDLEAQTRGELLAAPTADGTLPPDYTRPWTRSGRER